MALEILINPVVKISKVEFFNMIAQAFPTEIKTYQFTDVVDVLEDPLDTSKLIITFNSQVETTLPDLKP